MRCNSLSLLLTITLLLCISTGHASHDHRDRLLRQLQTAQSDTARIRLYGELYDEYNTFDARRAMDYLDKMVALAERTGNHKGMRRAYSRKGIHYYTAQQADSALVYFRKQLPLLRRDQLREKAKVYCSIGMVYNSIGSQDSALMYFTRTLKICRTTDCGSTYCAVLNNLGITVFEMGNTRKSAAYFEEAYTCMVEHGETADLPNVINNLASAYAMNGEKHPDKLFLDLLRDRRYTFSNDVKATIYMNLGAFYFRNEQPGSAEQYFLTADSLFRRDGLTNPEILHSLGSIRMQQKDNTGALRYFRQVLQRFPEYPQAGTLYRAMAQASFGLQDYDQAQHYYEKSLVCADSLNRTAVSDALEKAQENLDFLRKEAEISELTLKAKIRQRDEQRVRLIGSGVIIGLLLLAAIAVLFFRKERAKRKMNDVLITHKNEKIREFGEKIANRNKTIADIERTFAEYRDKQGMQEQLKEDIIDSLLLNGDSENFARYFEDQHKGFYEALKKHAPSLTNNDLRFCSLTRLRLSLKETADILNLSVDAVKSGRYRIRKKLGLETDDSLADFLNNLNEN